MNLRLLALFTVGSIASASFAQSWAEVGDAGELIAGAQTTTGGVLTSITGMISPSGGDRLDMFAIQITDAVNFTADTIGGSLNTQLFLFDTSGNGIAANDDYHFSSTASRIGGPTPISGLVAGNYIIGIGLYNSLAFDSVNASIWTNYNGNGTRNSGSGSLNHWTAGGATGGAYTINLVGAGALTPVPEPASLLAVAAGITALCRRRRRG